MIKVFWQEGKELGFTFVLFNNARFDNDFQSFPNTSQAKAYLLGSKVDAILFNLEYITLRFEEDPELKSHLRLQAEQKLRGCVGWVVEMLSEAKEDVGKYKKMCSTILKTEKFMTTLVNSVGGEFRQDAIMWWKVLYGFLRSEVNGKSI